jgi:hypothetical protein
MKLLDRAISALATVAAFAGLAGFAAAQGPVWPAKPLRWIVPFPTAGATDFIARPIAERLQGSLGQGIQIDNRPGAGGNIGMELAARAAADGYTFVWGTTSTHGVGPNVYSKLAYYPVKDLAAVSIPGQGQNVLVVNPGVPVRSVKDLVSLLRRQPGVLTYASSGNGTVSHLAGAWFAQLTGTSLIHAPYKGSGPAMVDLLGGQIDLMWDSQPSALPQVRAGKLRAIAVTSLKRSGALPDVPTIAEAGFPAFDVSTWWGLFAPAQTPRDIVVRMSQEIARAIRAPEVLARFAEQGVEPIGSTPEQAAAHVAREIEKWGKIVRAVGGLRLD